jgi:hypothetical protein
MNQKFDSYAIVYIGGPATPKRRGAYIYCYDQGTQVGKMQFFLNSSEVEPNTSSGTQIVLSFDMSRFKDVVQMLEFEKPLYLYLSGTDGRLGTSDKEPVGEQEGK